MNIVLGHCYTTKNKGDAGIVIATIETIKGLRPDAGISGMSTFASRDEDFIHHHQDYIAAGAEMIPALLPEDKLFVFGRVLTSTWAKTASLLLNLLGLAVGLVVFRINPAWVRGDVGTSLRKLASADLFISKGGSFIYNEGGMRGDISLFKLLVPFWVAKRLGLRTVILGQSLGPFHSGLSKWLFRRFLPSIDMIYLREKRCLKYLDYLDPDLYQHKVGFCPDLAFALESEDFPPLVEADPEVRHVGLTIVNHHFATSDAREAYIDAITRAVGFLRDVHPNTQFHIFPQVLSPAVDGSVDLELSAEVVQRCKQATGIEIDLVAGDHDARTLRETYRRMELFIATRLHSSIFAATVGVPTLVFGYHGTKAEGIWADLGFPEYFFDINQAQWPEVHGALKKIMADRDGIRSRLLERTGRHRELIVETVRNELARA